MDPISLLTFIAVSLGIGAVQSAKDDPNADRYLIREVCEHAGWKLSELLSPAAIMQVESLLDLGSTGWCGGVLGGTHRVFLVADLHGPRHFLFRLVRVSGNLSRAEGTWILDQAYGLSGNALSDTQMLQLVLFLDACQESVGRSPRARQHASDEAARARESSSAAPSTLPLLPDLEIGEPEVPAGEVEPVEVDEGDYSADTDFEMASEGGGGGWLRHPPAAAPDLETVPELEVDEELGEVGP